MTECDAQVASGDQSTVSGGNGNKASGAASSVSGGNNNVRMDEETNHNTFLNTDCKHLSRVDGNTQMLISPRRVG